MIRDIVIIGAGGFAREVEWLIRDINESAAQFRFAGYLVSDLSRVGEHDSHEQIIGDLGWLAQNDTVSVAIGIGNPAVRLRLGRELAQQHPGLDWPTLLHPSVRIDRSSASIGRGVLLTAGVIGTVDVTLDEFAMVNLACTLGHECRIGAGTVLNPTVNISGGVEIGEAVLIGTGAQVLQYVKVGNGSVVGAGAVVLKEVPEGQTVAGIPARVLERKSL